MAARKSATFFVVTALFLTCQGADLGDIQLLINGATDGDVVSLSGGSYDCTNGPIAPAGKQVTLQGASLPPTVIDCANGDYSVFLFDNDTVTIEDVAIVNIGTTGSPATSDPIFIQDGNVTFRNVVLDSITSAPAPVYITGMVDAAFVDCTFSNNRMKTAVSYAGVMHIVAVDVSSSVVITRGNFTGNVADGSAISFAGAIFCDDPMSLNITDSEFSNNNCLTCSGPGALNLEGTTANIVGTVFHGNTAVGAGADGGAIRAAVSSIVSLTDCTLTENAGQEGGAIYIRDSSTVSLLGTLITENSAVNTAGGGGVDIRTATINIDQSVVCGNRIGAASNGEKADILSDSSSVLFGAESASIVYGPNSYYQCNRYHPFTASPPDASFGDCNAITPETIAGMCINRTCDSGKCGAMCDTDCNCFFGYFDGVDECTSCYPEHPGALMPQCNCPGGNADCTACQAGNYGPACNETCACANGACAPEGNFVNECESCTPGTNWTGALCDQCPPGFNGACNDCNATRYGYDCLEECACPNGGDCNAGGMTVDSSECTACKSNTGWTIESNCAVCGTNWTGAGCDECDATHYGPSCDLECDCPNGACATGGRAVSNLCASCNANTGWNLTENCNVCNPRWTGVNCDQCTTEGYNPGCTPCACENGVCEVGTVDTPANRPGPTCASCTPMTGWILASQCETCAPEWNGACTQCIDTLDGDPRFGPACQECACANGVCAGPSNKSVDHRDCSSCTAGTGWELPRCTTCGEGWTGVNCDECDATHYGANCIDTCNCTNGACATGGKAVANTCASCVGGFQLPDCLTCAPGFNASSGCLECEAGLYGPTCDQACACISGQGVCAPSGSPSVPNTCVACEEGFYGSLCDQTCACVGGHGTCAASGDPTTSNACVACLDNTGWELGSDCATCATGWDESTNCTECEAGVGFPPDCRLCSCANGDCRPGEPSVCASCTPGTGWLLNTGCTACAANWDGACTECVDGFYGPRCEPCACANGGTCPTPSSKNIPAANCSSCASGTGWMMPSCTICSPGWALPGCTACDAEHYGPNCENTCDCGGAGRGSCLDDGSCSCVGKLDPATKCAECLEGEDCSGQGLGNVNADEDAALIEKPLMFAAAGAFACIFLVVASLFYIFSRRLKESINDTFSPEDEDGATLHVGKEDSVAARVRALLVNGTRIASNETAEVYKCTTKEGVTVAVKVYKITSTKQIEEFHQEISLLTHLTANPHPNVVQLSLVCTEQPLAVVMDFAKQGSLFQWLKKETHPEKVKIKAALDVARGVNHLHDNNVCHLDLKTKNLLVGDMDVVKVTDFGISVKREPLADEEDKTTDSQVNPVYDDNAGDVTMRELAKNETLSVSGGFTAQYVAPERLRHIVTGLGDAPSFEDLQRADVFSFGVVLWSIMTQRIPHEGMKNQAVVDQLMLDSFFRPEIPEKDDHPFYHIFGQRAAYPDWAKALTRMCWDNDPQKRPLFPQIVKCLESAYAGDNPVVMPTVCAPPPPTSAPACDQASRPAPSPPPASLETMHVPPPITSQPVEGSGSELPSGEAARAPPPPPAANGGTQPPPPPPPVAAAQPPPPHPPAAAQPPPPPPNA